MRRDRARLLTLDADPELGPTLFLYRWARPTITLGAAQRAEIVLDAERVRARGWPVVRRPTGGRAILHVEEWTWSAVVPLDHPYVGGSLRASLLALSETIVEALRALGVEALPAAGAGRSESGGTLSGGARACFAFAAGHEIIAAGRKLAGAAQRRLARAALTQGTLLVGPGHERLAEVLRGDDGLREATKHTLLEETVTLRELASHEPRFDDFAAALARAWRRRAVLRGRDS